jgi:hypothetical protein
MKPIIYKVTRFPPDDDPGWFDADVWDCPACGITRISHECETCVGCDAPQPSDSVYLGRCWGMKLPENCDLLGIPARPLIPSQSQSLGDVKASDDARFFKALRDFHAEDE